MIRATAGVRIWLATQPLDMRRSFDALAEHVRTILAHDPMSGHLFVFRNRSAQRVKIFWWDGRKGEASVGDGYALYYKRLERGTFQFPPAGQASVAVASDQLKRLLSGCPVDVASR